jgi:hypothetical protein
MSFPHRPPSIKVDSRGGEGKVGRDRQGKVYEQAIASLGGQSVREIHPVGCQQVEKEVGRHLCKAKLPGCYDRLVKLITGFKNPVRGAHANWEKAGPNHDGIKVPSVSIIGNISQTEGGRVLEEFRTGIRKKVWFIKAFIKNLEPTGSNWRIQFPTRKTV